jgi:hypothetical protein
MTPFTFLRLLSSTNSIPVITDEYKPYDMRESEVKNFHRYIRRLYSGEVEGKGKPDLSIVSYRLVAPLAFAGEQMPSEPAILERIIPINFAQKIPEEAQYRNSFETLRKLKLTAFPAKYIQFCLGLDVKPVLSEAEQLALELIGNRTKRNRVINNISIMVLGIRLFEIYGQQYGIDLDSDIGIEDAVNEILNQLVVGEDGRTKLALDSLIEMLSVMALNGRLKKGTHFDFNNLGELWFHFDSCFPEFRKYARETNYREEILNKNSYYRQMKEINERGGYIREISINKWYYFNTEESRNQKQMKSVVIDYTRCEYLDLGGFGISEDDVD